MITKIPVIPYPIQDVISPNLLDPKYCILPKSTKNVQTYISRIDNEQIFLDKKVFPNNYYKTELKNLKLSGRNPIIVSGLL